MAEKALALVVRGTDWSETSRISTLFTREFGKVRALAKGGRRLKSNFDVAFDLLSVCTIVFLRKASGGLDLLTEAQLVERFPPLRKDLASLYAGYYVAELLSDGTQDYDPHPLLFDAALATLRSLGEPGAKPAFAALRFELVWLHELGYSPRLDVCAACDTPVVAARPVSDAESASQVRRDTGVPWKLAYSPSAGGVVCSACAQAFADRRPLSSPALVALRDLTEGGEAGPELPQAVRTELRGLLGQVVSYVLGRRPRLLAYIEAADRRG